MHFEYWFLKSYFLSIDKKEIIDYNKFILKKEELKMFDMFLVSTRKQLKSSVGLTRKQHSLCAAKNCVIKK